MAAQPGGPAPAGAGCRAAFSRVEDLRQVWENMARLVVRFGVRPSARRREDPESLLRETLRETPWRVLGVRPAGSAEEGRRQARQFFGKEGVRSSAGEVDLVVRLCG